MRLRFPKSIRLAASAEFQRVKNEGVSFHGSLLILSVLKAPGLESRFGFITSRRVGNAVVRNRVRRRLREILRLARPGLVSGFHLVIIAKKGCAAASYPDLKNEWLRLANRAALLASA